MSLSGEQMALQEPLTKIEAVRRQLRTAIRLYFEEQDTVATHTLVAAARQILIDVLKRQRTFGTLMETMVRPEAAKEFFGKILPESENFFKHANRDPDATLIFRPFVTTVFLADCLEMYHSLTGRNLMELYAFGVWLALEDPESVSPEFRALLGPITMADLPGMDKATLFRELMRMIEADPVAAALLD